MKAELYILGVLHRGDFHPYEIKRRLTQAMIECFTDVDVGTLYYAVRQLAECGLLTAVAHQRVARGGMRTVYRITPRGRDRFCLITQRTLGNFLNCLAFNGLALWAAPLTPVDWLRISPAVG